MEHLKANVRLQYSKQPDGTRLVTLDYKLQIGDIVNVVIDQRFQADKYGVCQSIFNGSYFLKHTENDSTRNWSSGIIEKV